MTSQLHQLLLELIPGGAKKDLSAAQAKVLLAKVRPRDAAGKTRRRVAAELIADLERIYARKKAANKELNELLKATGTTLTDLHGVGASGAARLLSRSVTSPASRQRRTSRPGPAPPQSTRPPVRTFDIGSPAAATARSTGSYTSWMPLRRSVQPSLQTRTRPVTRPLARSANRRRLTPGHDHLRSPSERGRTPCEPCPLARSPHASRHPATGAPTLDTCTEIGARARLLGHCACQDCVISSRVGAMRCDRRCGARGTRPSRPSSTPSEPPASAHDREVGGAGSPGRAARLVGRYSPTRSRRVIQTTPTPAHGSATPVSAADAHGRRAGRRMSR